MKKLTKKLMLSILTVALTFIALGTSTFAWFSMNDTVTVTGMKFKTQVGDNLLIADGTTAATSAPADSEFKTSLVQNTTQTYIEPVSSIDGVNFFYTSTQNVAANGDAVSETYIAYVQNDDFDKNYGFNTASTQEAYGFIDYAFFLKAINTDSSSKDVKITALNLVYGGAEQTQKAFRVAVFVNNMGEDGSTAASAPTADTLKSIIRDSVAGYHTATAKAVNSTSTLAEVTKLDTALTVGSVAAGKTNYYKVVVRLWLEGEDTTCTNSTFAALTEEWALDVKVEIGGTNSAINSLSQSVTASKTDLSGKSSKADVAYDIAGTKYYEIDGATGFYLIAASTAVSTSSRVYKIVNNHPIDVTNQCKLS